jgi:heptosyltransferase-2
LEILTTVKKILVIQPAFIGDAVISIALAEALLAVESQAQISYLVRPESAGLLRYAPSISTVIAFDKYGKESGAEGIKKKAAELNQEQFDIIFCLHSSKRTLELVRHIDSPIKVGIVQNEVFTHYCPPHDGDDGAMKAVRIASVLYPAINILAKQRLLLPTELIPKSVSDLPKPIAGIAPGSVWRTKRWKASGYVELAEQLLKKGYSVVLLGLKTELDKGISDFDNLLNNNKINLLSKLSLEETAACISTLDLLITNDSAPIHIAVATQTQVVSIFGPTVPEFGFAPRKEDGKVVSVEGLWCRPCASHGSNECPIHTHECMEKISVEMVLEQVISI